MTGKTLRRLKAAGALVLLLILIVGVPTLLISLRLVPHGMPSFDGVVTALKSRDSGQLAGVVLAAGVWVCWALFTASTAAEILAFARARPVAVPGLRAFQRPASVLIAAVVFGFTIGPITAGGPSAAPLPLLPLPIAHPVTVLAAVAAVDTAGPTPSGAPGVTPAADNTDQPGAATTYRVQRRDTLWFLAERYLGDPLRYPEIIKLNPALVGSDNEIIAGTVLVMPGDATGLTPTAPPPVADTAHEDVSVHPGDTLWGLTERATGHGGDWPRTWEANRERREPGGARFTDPSLIRPGWTLTLPAPDTDVPQPGGIPPPQSTTDPRPTTVPEPTPTPERTQIAPATEAPTPPATAQSSATAVARSTAEPTPASAVSAAVDPSQLESRHAAANAGADLPMVAFTGGGLLLAGLSLAALLRYRRRQFRHRRPGRTISTAPPDLLPVERAVHTVGNDGIVDVTWLDEALRSLAQSMSLIESARLPDVIAACLTEDALSLVLTEPSLPPPTPWTADTSGTRWTIRRSDPLPYDEHRRPYTFAPYPTLASVGSTADGEHWLLDLERVGALTLSGHSEGCLNLARFLAAELAHNTWSEMLRVTLVGFGHELTPLNPNRLTVTDDVDQAVCALGAQLTAVTDATRTAEVDVLSGRLHDVAGDAWAPHVVLIASQVARDHAGLGRLRAALSEQKDRRAIALLVVDDCDPVEAVGWQLTVGDTGTLRIPALDLELVANRIPVDEAAQLAQMLALAADTDDRPMPPARGDRPWEEAADAGGALRVHPAQDPATPGRPALTSTAGGTVPPRTPTALSPRAADVSPQSASLSPLTVDSVLPLSPPTYLERAATTEQDLRALAPATNERVRSRVEAADPTLDADLADWNDPSCPRPKLTLLGPIEVRAQGSLPERNPRRSFFTETVAYLATRPTGATVEQYATAIWPHDPDVAGKTKVRQAIAVVRAWLGADPSSARNYLPAADAPGRGGRYRIDNILIDAELFRRLRLRGQARGADGITDLHAALDLVTGKPFDHLPVPRPDSPGGYTWLIDDNSRLDHEYAAMIVDVAHIVATHHLAAGEPALAADAARVALKAGSFEDVPLLDLVAASDAQGHRAEADSYVARILANHDAEVEEDLPPRTAELLFRRQWGDSVS